MEEADRKLFQQSIRRAAEQYTGAALDEALDELGWREALEQDQRDAVSILFEQQGAAHVTSSALDVLLATSLGLDPDHVSVVLPRLGRWDPPGELMGERLHVAGVSLRQSPLTVQAAVACAADASVTLVATSDLATRTVSGLDPALGLVEVRSDVPQVGDIQRAAADWSAAVAIGRVAIAHELAGMAGRMLELARVHALERVQFGRPIATFQAIRHRLAESLVAVESAQASVAAAWDDRSPFSAAMAKAIAGSSARTVARHAQQVLGGMGYTTEHPLHGYVRRTVALDQLLGASRAVTTAVGQDLLRTRQLPAILPL